MGSFTLINTRPHMFRRAQRRNLASGECRIGGLNFFRCCAWKAALRRNADSFSDQTSHAENPFQGIFLGVISGHRDLV